MAHGESLRPEPHLNRWQESGRLAYRSEDVLVRNARNWDGQAWTDDDLKWDALIDAENRIVARVHNAGPLDAPGVAVIFQYAEWGAGQGEQDWVTLSTTSVDLPAHHTVEVESEPWILKSEDGVTRSSHHCVRVLVSGDESDPEKPYSIPGSEPPLLEINPNNAVAQSNVALVYSSTASPSSRVEQPFRIHNPFDEPRAFRLELVQDNPLFRTYLAHRWVVVPAQGSRDVPILVEYAEEGKDPALIDRHRDLPNYVNIRASTLLEEDDFGPTGGATLVVRRGNRTAIVEFMAAAIDGTSDVLIRGEVREVASGRSAPDAVVVLTLTGGDSNPRALRVPMRQGRFEERVPGTGWTQARALYVPPVGYAEAHSDSVRNPY